MLNAEMGNVLYREVTGLTAGTTYYWRVKAGNSAGWSGWSTTGSMLCN
jgi:phosphodiesterase/alkaline phosphatase D-like protein